MSHGDGGHEKDPQGEVDDHVLALGLYAFACGFISIGWSYGKLLGEDFFCAVKFKVLVDDMLQIGILIHMRTTLHIEDALVRKASELTGVKEKTSLVRLGLEALIARESARRLAALGGTEKSLRRVRRRRSRASR